MAVYVITRTYLLLLATKFISAAQQWGSEKTETSGEFGAAPLLLGLVIGWSLYHAMLMWVGRVGIVYRWVSAGAPIREKIGW